MNVLRILNRNFGIIAFLFTVVMANAYDVLGPYNNSNTMIEYTTFRTGPGQPDHTYLYALNSFDKFRELAGSTYCVFLRNQIDTHSDIWNPLRFHTSGGNPVFDVENFYPTLLGRNLTSWELNDWALSATARRAMYVRNCSRNSGIGGIHWFNAWDASGSGATWYSRLVVSRTNSAIQWLASDNTVHETAGKFSKTLDGWNNGSTLLGTGLPGLLEREYCVYSLGIDDRGLPGGVLRAVCTITHQALPIDGLEDPHLVITECLGEGIYVSDDAGETWEPETPSNWPENAFNVHVAMVPSVAGQPNGDYMVYVLGTEIDGAGDPHVFCKWTEWNSGGTFDTWESSSVEGINEGTAEQPTYPYDLVVEWDPVAEAYMLLAATSEKVYYALHDGVSGDVGWEERMGSGNSAIRTLNFRKIAVDSTARSTNFAVAGESCTYYTADAGETWAPIHNSGRYATTVQGGVQQKLGSENLFALYTRQPYGQNDEFAPVNVQIAPYQDGSSVGRFEKTIQVASTWNNLRNNVILHQSSGGGILFVANPDPLLTDNGINSSGIVRHSEDEGETWTPATWSNMVLSSDEGSAPIPFELTSDPVNPDFVFITFQNADVPGVPPFARSTDGGETWSVPGGLPPAWLNGEPKHLAVGNNNSTAQIVYLYTSDNLYRSIDGGNNWAQLTIPVAAQDAVDIAVMQGTPDRVTICSSTRLIRSGDAGVTWHVSSALLAGYEYKAIQAELQNVDAIWAILSNGETWRLDLRSDRYVNQGIIVGSWVDANIQGMKLFTEFSIAQVNGPSLSRVFWSISSYNGQPFLAEDPTQVRFYERWVWGTPYPPDDVVYVVEPVTIPIGETLTIPAGSELVFLNEGKITVDGTMVIGSNQGPVTVLRSNDDSDPSARWQGLVVNGSITMENCELKGAETGIETSKANSLILSGSTISKCGTGLLAYQPSGTAFPQITGCTFSNNDNYGASLLSTVSTTFDECIFTGNGADGMLLTNSYAKIISCDFTDNGEAQGGYGLNCFGSSPMLSCNNFDENKKGEIVLYNQSYPAMEPSGGGGKNTLFNSARNLIEMWSSYPLTKNGHNNFKVGGTGYFMADMSAAPKKRDISGNYWNPSLGLSKLYPSSSSVYTWNSIDGTVNSCGGTGSGSGAGAAQQMFADGIAEQSSGNYSAANTLLADVVTQYPDSEWANAALAQMFVTQCMVGDGYPTLQTYMNDIPDDSTLAEPAEVFATRLWVEDEQYAPALETYEATMTNPPSEVDSIFAAVDFAVATYRAQAEGGSLDEVNSADVKDIFRQLDMVSTTIPPSPEASHEGFAVIPTEVALEANFPNPFNAETTIRYYLPEAQFAEVSIFNIVGQKVATLVSGQMSAGFHDVHWSGSDLASGVYLYQLKTGGAVETRKMVLLK